MFLCKNMIKGRNLLRKLENASIHLARNASKAKYLRELPPQEVEELLERCQDKIVYSSYLESFYLRLDYKRQRIMESKLKTAERKQMFAEADVKKFPLILKYLDETTYKAVEGEEHDSEEDFETIESEKRYYIPYSDVKTIWRPEKSNDEKKPETSKWMQDYEHYDEGNENELDTHSEYGTPNPNIPVSKVPCSGCGAHLHCAEPSIPGYIPSEIFKNRTDTELTTIICQRCHFLKNYNTAINVSVTPEDYINVISSIRDKKALAVLLIDLLDIENSIWPGIMEILGPNRHIIVIGNKVDLLPRDHPGHLDHVRKCVQKAIVEAGFSEKNILHIGLISATTGFGVEELITKVHHVWGRRAKGDVYIIGCTNVGKSSLFNALLQSDFCKSEASSIINRATASPWPGTTMKLLKFPILRPSDYRLALRVKRIKKDRKINLEEEQLRRIQSNKSHRIEHATLVGHIGRTFMPSTKSGADPFSMRMGEGTPIENILTVDENHKIYKSSTWCYDTPGVVQPEQILNLLTTEELLKVLPKRMITPRAFMLKKGMSIFLAGLARVDFLDGIDWTRVQIFSSTGLPIIITRTEDADEIYETLLGSEILGVPFGSEERLENFPKLKSSDDIELEGIHHNVNCSDILLSSIGWFSAALPTNKKAIFRTWTPDARGIVVRRPALIPYGINLRGKRIRHTYAYNMSKPFISFTK